MRHGFSLLEIIFSLVIVALISAVLGSLLINSIKAQKRAYQLLEPRLEVQACLQVLRDDIVAALRPNGTTAVPCQLSSLAIGQAEADQFQISTAGPAPIHYAYAVRPVHSGQAQVVWSVEADVDSNDKNNTNGLLWLRGSQPHGLASGSVPTMQTQVMLDRLAYVSLEVLINGTWQVTYNSDEANAVLPQALRVRFARLDEKGVTGPEQIVSMNFPQVLLDPIQMAGG